MFDYIHNFIHINKEQLGKKIWPLNASGPYIGVTFNAGSTVYINLLFC